MFEHLFEDVRRRRKQFRVYAPADPGLDSKLATRNATVTHRPLGPEAPGGFLTIHDDGEFRGAVPLDTVATLLEPPVVGSGQLGDLSEPYRALVEVLDETVFGALDRRQLIATSREIEDRAFRVGRGTLHAGFQSLSAFESQVEAYRRLAGETHLSIHVYGRPDWTPPEIEGVTYHGTDAIEPYWVVAFDGGGTATQRCALVARETGDGFEGWWTYDPELVGRVVEGLTGL